MNNHHYPNERRAVLSLATLYIFRMLGLFMVLPVLSLYSEDYRYSSHFLIGLALGAYGCSQAILQIPFGMWSDRWGRKPVILFGLLLFALGSVIAAMSDTIYGLILGRFLQGTGAIASAIMAMVADLTADENRTKAMASIGASIGVSFALAFILGPIVANFGGVSAIFWVTAAFALIGTVVLVWVVPEVPKLHVNTDMTLPNSPLTSKNITAEIYLALKNRELLRLDFGIFILHFILMASFLIVPRLLENSAGIPREQHPYVYTAILVASFIVMLPFIILAERKGKIKPVFVGAVGLFACVQLLLAQFFVIPAFLLAGLFLFFLAFNLLEATLPSLVSKISSSRHRGTANGVYSTSQFLGAFLGGALGSLVLTYGGEKAVFVLCAGLAACWFWVAMFMAKPKQLSSVMVTLAELADQRQWLSKLQQIPGVAEVAYIEERQAARLKVDRQIFEHRFISEMGLSEAKP
ncbi:MFS transporter [Aurantivibrio infirmus]